MTVILKETLKPNLIQTLEGQACFMHCGPFANIAHGNNSLVADKVGLKLGDIVHHRVRLRLRHGHGEVPRHRLPDRRARAERRRRRHDRTGAQAPRRRPGRRPRRDRAGVANLGRHIGIVKEFGLEPVVAVNRRPEDTDEECEVTRKLALDYGAFAAELNEAFAKGGDGATALAEAVVGACEQPNSYAPLYELDDPIAEKIEKIATRVYGADGVEPAAGGAREGRARTRRTASTACRSAWRRRTSPSRTTRALVGAPTGFVLPVRDLRSYTGAGWLVALCGDMQTMPGLGVTPALQSVDIDENGGRSGLF